MNYSEMSDFEINEAVAKIACPGAHSFHKDRPSADAVSIFRELESGDVVCSSVFDYCNNPSDACPIVFENKISTTWVGSYWNVIAPLDNGMFSYKARTEDDILRAAMIVFLMMNEADSGI